MPDHTGLACGHAHDAQGRLEAADDDGHVDRRDAATSNVTDLRRARQHARAVVRDIQDAVVAWMAANNVQSYLSGDASQARQVNRAVTEIASRRFQEELVAWLDQRNRTTMGRAARAAFDKMRQVTDADASFRSEDRFTGRDIELVRQIRQVDAGLLYDTELAERLGLDEPLAEELGNRITRTLRQGVAQDERVSGGLRQRVQAVMTDGSPGARQETNVSGQTTRSKAELIAHDSVQDAYNTGARARYLRNGFRYAVYDATLDTKTTQLCRRMNEHVIDLRDHAFFVPPLHPYCRSGIRPILDVEDRSVLGRDDVADDYMRTIMQTKSYRPPVDTDQFRPTPLSREYGHTRS
jgi:SPP1 gp7 family putative phage head morphogenesis protein